MVVVFVEVGGVGWEAGVVGVGGWMGCGRRRGGGGRGCGSFMNFLGGFVAGWRGWCVWWQFYVGVGFAFGLASVCCWLAEVKLKKFLVTGCFLWLVQLSKKFNQAVW